MHTNISSQTPLQCKTIEKADKNFDCMRTMQNGMVCSGVCASSTKSHAELGCLLNGVSSPRANHS